MPPAEVLEYPLFTDAALVGEIVRGAGPYQVLNAIAEREADRNVPRAYLRVELHPHKGVPDLRAAKSHHYHGGLIHDEIAALLSLCLGIRLKAGGLTRLFQPNGDPRGRPYSFKLHGQEDPILLQQRGASILPRAVGEHSLDEAKLLHTFADLSPKNSIAVARAARLYQDALWIAESEPELSWVMLVSAVETAAHNWSGERESPLEMVRAAPYGPALEQALTEGGSPELMATVAELLAPYTGSTRKFREFLLGNLPDPPAERPPEHARISWEEPPLRKAFNVIYGYRSKALHGGQPFPAPMCWPPRLAGHDHAEKLWGAAGARGAVWSEQEMPMLLSTFEYMVRHALHRWWQTLLPLTSGGT